MESSKAASNSLAGDGSPNIDYTNVARVLPRDIIAKFLAEGAANIIYRIVPKAPSQNHEHIEEHLGQSPVGAKQWPYQLSADIGDSQLLRLRKDLDHIAPTALMYGHFVNNIKPLFDASDLLRYDLVNVKESGIVDHLNSDLRKWEAEPNRTGDSSLPSFSRGARRKGVYLAKEPYGLLVNDMSAPPGTRLIEFKPKWLQQSPAAPKGSKRCRTCAKRARDNALKGERSVFGSFCPLDLTSKDYEVLIRPAKAILNIEDPQQPDEIKKLYEFCEWARSSVVHKLAAIQSELDPKGVFNADPKDNNFLTAMSLRDCSLFLLIPDLPNPEDPNQQYEARLGDLDPKLSVKVGYWRSVELPLIEEGWYMGTEAEELRQPLDCGLYPEYWTPASKRHLLVVPE